MIISTVISIMVEVQTAMLCMYEIKHSSNQSGLISYAIILVLTYFKFNFM